MELLRPCLFIYLLAILLSLSSFFTVSSTTNSDHIYPEEFEWKGGDGVKRSRVRRQNLHLPNALSLPEKAYVLFILWRLLDDVSNDSKTIRTSTMRPYKLESMSSEGPKNTEIIYKAKDKPSSAPTQEQSIHSTGIAGTNDSAKASLTSSTYSQKTTRSQLVKQSTQRLQATIQKIPETSEVIDQHNPDSTTLPIKSYSKAAEEPPSTIIHERIDHFTGITDSTTMISYPTHSSDSEKKTQSGDFQLAEHSSTITKQEITEPSQVMEQHIPHSKTFTIKMSSKAVEETSLETMHEESTDFTGTNDSTAVVSFTTEMPPQESQNNTQSGTPQPFTQSTQHLQHSKPNSSVPSEVTEQHITDSTTLTINISKAVEEPPSATIHERSDHFTGITDIKDSTTKASFQTHSPDSQQTTQSDSRLVKQSIQQLQTTIQKPPETSQATEQHNPDSKNFTIKMSSKAVEETSLEAMHEESTDSTGTNDSTAVVSFTTEMPPQESQNNTQSGTPQPFTQSTQHLHLSKPNSSVPSEVTEQHITDSTTLTINISKAVEEPPSATIHERSDHFTGITDTKDSTTKASFQTHSPDSQETTQSDSRVVKQSIQQLQTTIQKPPETSQATEQHNPDSKNFTIKMSSKAVEETSLETMHEESTDSTGTNDSTAVVSFTTEMPPQESQNNTQSGAPQPFTQSTQHLQHSKPNSSVPSEVTEQHITDSTTLTINISKAVEEPPSATIHERSDHFTGITDIKDSTTKASFQTHSPDSQQTTQSDSRLVKQSIQQLQTTIQKPPETSQATEQHNPDSKNFTIKMSSKAVEETSLEAMHEESTDSTGTNDSTAVVSFTTEMPPQESQNNTQSGAPQPFTQSTQHLQHSKPNSSVPSEVTEQHITDSTTLTINISKAVEEPPSATIHERSDHFTGITDTKDSTTKASFQTHSPDSQQTTQSDSRLVKQSIQQLQTTIQKPPETSQATEQHNPDSKTFTIKMSSKAVEETSLDTMHEESTDSTSTNDSTGTKDSTAVASFTTELPPQESQNNTQSGAPQPFTQSTQHLQHSKPNSSEPSEVTEQHIDSTTLTINIFNAVEEPSSATIHERIDHFTGITDTKDFTAKASFQTHSQETTQSGDSQLVKQSIQRLQTTIQKPPETSQVTEQHKPDSTTLPIKNYSKAVEEPSSTIIHEQIDHFTGITDSTTMTSFPTHSPDSQKKTQSGDSQLAEHSSTITKQKITEPSQVMEQHIPHSKTFTIKMSSKAVEETSLETMHEESTDSTGTNDSTAVVSFTTEMPPQESQNNTQSGAPQPFTQSTQHLHLSKPNSSVPSEVTEQHITDSTTLTINISKAVEEPPSATIHERSDHFTGITDTKDSTTKASFQTHSPDSQQTTQSDSRLVKQSIQQLQTTIQKPPETSQVTEQHNPDSTTLPIKKYSKAVEEPPSATIHERSDHFTGINDTKDSTALSSFPTHSQKATPSGDSQLAEHSSTITKQKITEPSQVTEQHIHSSKAVKATSLDIVSEESTHSSGTNYSTAITSFYSSMSSKTASTSPLPSLTEDRLVDSKGPGNTSVPTGISLHLSTSSAAPFTTYQRNLKTQSQSTTNKYSILGSIMSHTSVLLAKDTSTQTPTDKVRPSQTIPASTEKLTVTFTPNTKPSEKHIHTTSVVRRGFLTLRTPEIPSSISTKQSNFHSTETKEPRSDLTNQEPTADIVANENYTNKDLLTEMDKPMQSTIGGKLIKTTRPATTKLHKSKTQKVSRNPKKFILPTHKSADTAMQDHIETHRGNFGLFFTFGCFLLLIIVILLWVVWRRWQARRWRNDMWVAGPPLLWGTYHSVLQSSSIHTPLEMRKGNTQRNKQENSDVYESIALKQQHKDLQ